MSGSPGPDAEVHLVGPMMVQLVGALPVVQQMLARPVIIGGLAVMSRLGTAHRVTRDLDALRERTAGSPTGLELLAAARATAIDEVGGLVPTDRGPVRVDVLDAPPLDPSRHAEDPTDRLEASAFDWALRTATPIRFRATASSSPREADAAEAVALVARPGPLVAMKLKAAVDRSSAKEATDLLDVVLLATDHRAAPIVLDELTAVDDEFRGDLLLHLELEFERDRLRIHRLIRAIGHPGVDTDLIDGAAAFLRGALE